MEHIINDAKIIIRENIALCCCGCNASKGQKLEESVIVSLNQLAEELHSTKTEVIEKAIQLFSKQNNFKQNQLLQFAGKIKARDAESMLVNIQQDKNSKEFELDFEMKKYPIFPLITSTYQESIILS